MFNRLRSDRLENPFRLSLKAMHLLEMVMVVSELSKLEEVVAEEDIVQVEEVVAEADIVQVEEEVLEGLHILVYHLEKAAVEDTLRKDMVMEGVEEVIPHLEVKELKMD